MVAKLGTLQPSKVDQGAGFWTLVEWVFLLCPLGELHFVFIGHEKIAHALATSSNHVGHLCMLMLMEMEMECWLNCRLSCHIC